MNPRLVALVLALGAAPALAGEPRPLAEATLVRPDGKTTGHARFLPRSPGVALEIEVWGVAPGPHGLHLHAVGRCDGPDFASAGPHLNPAGHEHGNLNPKGSHLGDLPNVVADDKGRISATIRSGTRPFKLMSDVLDKDGSALVLHATADDYTTDPSGNSGARIACGIFARP